MRVQINIANLPKISYNKHIIIVFLEGIMRFVKLEEIRLGMRLAKPIYNKDGVLLYGRNTTVTDSVLSNLKHINTYGQYILEPAEPLPPMSDEELEFERFTTVASFTLKQDLHNLIEGNEATHISELVKDICNSYCHLTHKITFLQSLRSPDDSVYKHSINVAILCALISNRLRLDPKEQKYLVTAAFYHDIGKLLAPAEIINKTGKLTSEELKIIRQAELEGYELIKNNYSISAGIRRYIVQLRNELCNKIPSIPNQHQTLLLGTKLIQVADMYDTLTAMRVYKDPCSEFAAIKFLFEKDDEFDEKIVQALAESINILPPGCCVELTNNEKGLVLTENEYYILRPSVLGFSSNQVYDLGQKKVYEKIQIKDIMKTMDNRFIMKQEGI